MVNTLSKPTVNKVIEKYDSTNESCRSEKARDAHNTGFNIQWPVWSVYVTCVLHEKLFEVIDSTLWSLWKMDIDIKKCIGKETDGAANMKGQ